MNSVQPSSKNCSYCGEHPPKLKGCSRCREVFYCNVECQTAHWHASHKKICKPVVKMTAADDPWKGWEKDRAYFEYAEASSTEVYGATAPLAKALRKATEKGANCAWEAIPNALRDPTHPRHALTCTLLQHVMTHGNDYVKGNPYFKLIDDLWMLEGRDEIPEDLIKSLPEKIAAIHAKTKAANRALALGLSTADKTSAVGRSLIRNPLYDRMVINRVLKAFTGPPAA